MTNFTIKGKNSTKLMSVFGMIAIVIILLGNASNPPNAHTGAPGEGLCSNCHSGTSSIQGDILISGLPSEIFPSTSYDITVTLLVTSGTAVRGGFQLVALDGNDANAGTFSNAGSNVAFESSGGRTYAEHRPFKPFGGNNSVDFDFTWTSPTTLAGNQLTMYFVGNLANGNGSTSGDRIVNSNIVATMGGGSTDPQVQIVDVNHVLCFNGNDGSATAVASEGIPPYMFNWSNGGQSANISNLTAGTYTVTVTDANAATATAAVVITQPDELIINLVSAPVINCFEPEVEVQISAVGGVGPYNYVWNTGATGMTISVSQGGTYTATVTDVNNCTQSLSVSITEDIEAPAISAGPDKEIACFNGLVVLDGSGPAGADHLIEWTTIGGNIVSGGNTYNPTVDAAGTYLLTVVSISNGCSSDDAASVGAVPDELTTSTSIQNVSCFGGNDGSIALTVEGGSPPYSFLWSNGANTQHIQDLSTGTYNVTIIDANDCLAFASAEISQPDMLQLVVQTTPISAPEANDGTATGTVSGGEAPYSYAWSNGETTQQITDLAPGIYTLTITDSNECTATASGIVLSIDCDLEIVIVRSQDLSCFESGDGLIEIDSENGEGEVLFNWSNGSSGVLLTDLAAGTYTVTATDENSCITTLDIVLLQPQEIIIETEVVHEQSGGSSNGTIFASVSGGREPYTYLWSNGETTEEIIDLSVGVYSLTVTDSDNCTKVIIIEVFECDIDAEVSIENQVLCFGNSGGELIVNAESSFHPITYIWNNNVTSQINSGLAAGIYIVTATDAIGCTSSLSIELTQPDPLTLTTIQYTPEITMQGTGIIEVSMSGGVPNYVFSWLIGGAPFGTDIPLIEELDAAIYTLVVNDANECSLIETFQIELVSSAETDSYVSVTPMIFPNPTSSHINLAWVGSSPGSFQIDIRDLRGIVHSNIPRNPLQNNFESFPVEHLPNGLYILTVTSTNNTWSLPFVKH